MPSWTDILRRLLAWWNAAPVAAAQATSWPAINGPENSFRELNGPDNTYHSSAGPDNSFPEINDG